ncbi:helix-turn-helix transcriptional regulator [Plantactinospora endophytica]|uniref:AraC family transcriptional regulator n=1 Tax=Plantactinospora endophytica TaxID=673535 RepID=A0ABQ4DY78_9ACTN|nr:helix-turn-helix transcriptional regulator [Plantactinospora endophytica]GIG87410.1 AraC family transcriptional regulator [Plantactinospora endophytica]
MARLTQIHSIPAEPQDVPCETIVRHPHPRLRQHVLGYAGFRAGARRRIPHRLLPLSYAILLVDFADPYTLVTGARSRATVAGRTDWAYGVSVGLTPVGASALLGVPMPELAGVTAPLPDLVGPRADGLAERLGAAPDWPSRFGHLDRVLAGWLAGAPADRQDGLVSAAWWRLSHSPQRLRVGALADRLGVSRRYLELGFRRQVGLSPATVARTARFQHALGLLVEGADLAGAAADTGYADQPHFTREVRALSGLTPTELCAFLQYPPVPTG